MVNTETEVGNNVLRIGLVGSLPPPLGGVTVLFYYLVKSLEDMTSVQTRIVKIPFGNQLALDRTWRTFTVLRNVLKVIPDIDVLTLHVPTPVLPILGPLCYAIARFHGKAFLIRKFGGTDYTKFGFLRRALSVWVVNRCDAYLAESRELVALAQSHGSERCYWYPNNRPVLGVDSCNELRRGANGRFVFIGQVRRTKGVFELAEAADQLELDSPVDIFGPLYDGITESSFEQYRNVRYRGILDPKEVFSTLKNYGVFVLPTYHQGEGYPGAILEAYSAGLPVICTRWRVLPEIVGEDCGLLVPPRDIKSLREAMITFLKDFELYSQLRKGAIQRANEFSTEEWAKRFVDLCKGAAITALDRVSQVHADKQS